MQKCVGCVGSVGAINLPHGSTSSFRRMKRITLWNLALVMGAQHLETGFHLAPVAPTTAASLTPF
jgi:hypothetical protein